MGSKIKKKYFWPPMLMKMGKNVLVIQDFFFCDKIFMSNYDRAQANQPPITWTP